MQVPNRMPTGAELNTSILRMHLDAERLLDDAVAANNKAEISERRKVFRSVEKMMRQYGLSDA